MQLRVNMEVMDEEHGATKPTGGTPGCSMFDLPSGSRRSASITFGYSGYKTSAAFDSLLAKVIVHSARRRTMDRTWCRRRSVSPARWFRIGGVATNIPFLAAILAPSGFLPANHVSNRFLSMRMPQGAWLLRQKETTAETLLADAGSGCGERTRPKADVSATGPAGSVAIPGAACRATIRCDRGVREKGDLVRPGQQIAVLESMKMEHLGDGRPHGGKVTKVIAGVGMTLMQDEAHPCISNRQKRSMPMT